MSPQYFPLQPPFGGTDGAGWDDMLASVADPIVAIEQINMSTGDYVDSVGFVYLCASGKTLTTSHGGTGGSAIPTIVLAADEVVIGVTGAAGQYLNALGFMTSQPDPLDPGSQLVKTYGPFGGDGGSKFQFWGNVMAFFGSSGQWTNNLGLYLDEPTVAAQGGGGGAFFCDPVVVLDPPVENIAEITIGAGTSIDSITTIYQRSDGTQVEYGYGGTGGTSNVITFGPGETIMAVVGSADQFLNSITFLTIDGQGKRNTYGHYGQPGGNDFIVNAQVEGFFGRAGTSIDALGFLTAYPPTANLTIFGANGYLYTVLRSTDETNTSSISVGPGTTDLSMLLQPSGIATGASFSVTGPDGTVYDISSNGPTCWAVPQGPGLTSFYVANPAPGTWTATVTATADWPWSLVSSASSQGATAQLAFSQLSASERQQIQRALSGGDGQIPPEICYFCQAQMMAIMGLALATFYFWAGTVTATSAPVLYATRLLGGTAGVWAGYINSAYDRYQQGATVWNLAKYLCQLEGMCPASADGTDIAYDGDVAVSAADPMARMAPVA